MKEIIKKIATDHDMTEKKAREVVKSVFDALADDLARGGDVRLTDFGTFEVRVRKARTGRNPRTGEKIPIAASRFPAFKASKKLKDKVAGPQASPQAAPEAALQTAAPMS